MNVFAKFDEILSMILQDVKETKCYGHTHTRKDGQCENRGGGGGGINICHKNMQKIL